MTKELARDSGGRKLLMIFIICNAAESFIWLHLETLEKIWLLAALTSFTKASCYLNMHQALEVILECFPFLGAWGFVS